MDDDGRRIERACATDSENVYFCGRNNKNLFNPLLKHQEVMSVTQCGVMLFSSNYSWISQNKPFYMATSSAQVHPAITQLKVLFTTAAQWRVPNAGPDSSDFRKHFLCLIQTAKFIEILLAAVETFQTLLEEDHQDAANGLLLLHRVTKVLETTRDGLQELRQNYGDSEAGQLNSILAGVHPRSIIRFLPRCCIDPEPEQFALWQKNNGVDKLRNVMQGLQETIDAMAVPPTL
ncbi:hypothetical protein C8J56DRAFT_883931 [Mycena floridula]|nr:hypothetical protein C8J56DRAFT_883931 [Mycena floridula]